MEGFVQRHKADVTGVLSGFDRILFRGTILGLAYGRGLDKFLGAVGVRYKDYGEFSRKLTERVVCHAQQMATRAGRP